MINAFGSTFQSEFESEIHEVTTQQGLSPRGRKEVRQYNKSQKAHLLIQADPTQGHEVNVFNYQYIMLQCKEHQHPRLFGKTPKSQENA